MLLYAIFALVLNREVLGKARYLVLMGYRLQTLCMLLILGVLIGPMRTWGRRRTFPYPALDSTR
jgi:hypothetical protein